MTAQQTAQHILPAELIPDLLKAQQRTGTFNWKVTALLTEMFCKRCYATSVLCSESVTLEWFHIQKYFLVLSF